MKKEEMTKEEIMIRLENAIKYSKEMRDSTDDCPMAFGYGCLIGEIQNIIRELEEELRNANRK